MPFLTEEIWQLLQNRKSDEALIVASYPLITAYNTSMISDFELVKQIVSGIRSIRKEKNIPFKDSIDLAVINNLGLSSNFDEVIKKLCHVSNIENVETAPEGAFSFRVQTNEYFIPVLGNVNIEEEIAKIKSELNYTEGFLKSVQSKLTNERFVNNAPAAVIENERKKETDALAKIETLKAALKNLN